MPIVELSPAAIDAIAFRVVELLRETQHAPSGSSAQGLSGPVALLPIAPTSAPSPRAAGRSYGRQREDLSPSPYGSFRRSD